MLPVRLELRNFLAYRTPAPLEFEGLTLACLSGPNGAGKSSLLDAMTWALWGRARAKTDDEMIHLGQEEMYVIFDFRQDEVLYRVVRKRSKKGRGQGSLDLFVWDDTLNQLRLISESTMRDTQNRIVQLLKLDYETFIHSALIQQGKADLFTTAAPAQAKKILADILSLSRWEQYEKHSKEQLRSIEEQLRMIEMRIGEIEREEVNEPALIRQLAQAALEVEEARQTREAAEALLAEVASAPNDLQTAQKQVAALQRRIREYEQDIFRLDADIAQHEERRGSYQSIIESRDEVEAGFARLESARQADSDLGHKLSQQQDIKDQLTALQRELDAERAALDAQIGVIRDRIAQAEQVVESGEAIEVELGQVEVEIAALEKRRSERENIQIEREARLNDKMALTAQNETLRLEMDAIKTRIELLQVADGALCPVCGQPLDEPHRLEFLTQGQADGKERGDTYRHNQSQIKTLIQEIKTADEGIQAIEREVKGLDSLTAKQGKFHQRWEAITEARQRLDVERANLEDLEKMLDQENFSHELRGQIAAMQAEIDGLGYDRAAHGEAREALQSLRGFEAQMRALNNAIELLPELESQIDSMRERAERMGTQYTDACDEAARLGKEIEALSAKVEEARRRQSDLNRLRIVERSTTEKLISIQQQLSAIEAARIRKAELETQRDALHQEEAIYGQLRDAFSKNGVPAMIIDAAIPELEDAANRLLIRMTDGRMHVRLDTQRTNKSGEVRETLDILIGDELGTRMYELYSGGEGFRVNFALRVALSQFLAHRAGARLQTLVIDEGFGSQDDAGRERLVEAINAIRDDFDMILIVTHIDELRDAFPVRIEVRKTPDGSTVEIV